MIFYNLLLRWSRSTTEISGTTQRFFAVDLLIFYILPALLAQSIEHAFLPYVRGFLRMSPWELRLASGTLIYLKVGRGREVGVEKPHPKAFPFFYWGKSLDSSLGWLWFPLTIIGRGIPVGKLKLNPRGVKSGRGPGFISWTPGRPYSSTVRWRIFVLFFFPLCIDISVYPQPSAKEGELVKQPNFRAFRHPVGWNSHGTLNKRASSDDHLRIRLNGQGGSGKNMGILAGKRIGRRGEWKYGKWKKEKNVQNSLRMELVLLLCCVCLVPRRRCSGFESDRSNLGPR